MQSSEHFRSSFWERGRDDVMGLGVSGLKKQNFKANWLKSDMIIGKSMKPKGNE